MRLVRAQLAKFRGDMEKEGALQREEVSRLVAGGSARAVGIVDSALRLSREALSAYVLGGQRDAALLPVARRFGEGGAGAAGVAWGREEGGTAALWSLQSPPVVAALSAMGCRRSPPCIKAGGLH